MITRMLEETAVISEKSSHAESTGVEKRFRSPLRYPGGKQKAIDQIALLLPPSAKEFREPLVGGGAVFFHARSIQFAEKYWINDLFSELFAFWQAVQNQETCERLMTELEELRAMFGSDSEKIKKYFLRVRNEKMADRFRAAFLFFFFNRVTFSGTTRAGGFSSAASLRRFTESSIQRLAPMPKALENVEITNFDFEDCIHRPGDDVFIFLDPPYFKASRLYGRGGILHDFDHERLSKALFERKDEHKFLITYDDCPEIRQLYKWANVQDWQLRYGMNNCNLKKESKLGAELFISNY